MTTSVTAFPLGLPLGPPSLRPGRSTTIPPAPASPPASASSFVHSAGCSERSSSSPAWSFDPATSGSTRSSTTSRARRRRRWGSSRSDRHHAMDVSLNGLAGSRPQGFIRNPTSCATATTTFTATSYTGATATTPATKSGELHPTGLRQPPLLADLQRTVDGVRTSGDQVGITTSIDQTRPRQGCAPHRC